MLLTEITLFNFRQFKGKQTITFSDDTDRNVTVIIGENGSGKTTLAQAFTWCLYGDTDFKNKSVVNLSVAQELAISDKTFVYVELTVKHKDVIYKILRKQSYQKDRTGSIKSFPTKLTITYKDKGEIETVRESQLEAKIKEILPKELSRYFFFDGERIEKMSDEIQSGKSDEFAEAVKRLLGLNTYTAAIQHLGGKERAGRNNSVLGSFNAQFDSSSDDRIRQYSESYDRYQQELDKLSGRKVELEDNIIPQTESECERLSNIIAKNKDGERLSSECKRLTDKIKRNNTAIDTSTDRILSSFKKNYKYFFYKKMVADALEVLSDADKIDKGIPDIHARTIEYLIKAGTCICGNEICDGSAEHKALIALLDYIPPQSLGTLISGFAKDCKARTENGDNIFDTVSAILSDVNEKMTENDDWRSDIQALEEKIAGFENIGVHQQKLNSYRNDLKKKQSELADINMKIGAASEQLKRIDSERQTLALQSDTNKKLAVYIAYAKKIYDILVSDYSNREKEVRNSLEAAINDIFYTIYKGGLSLSIDEKYNIQTIINDDSSYNGVMDDTSTAQSISIIFAFIAGVIKVARESKDDNDLATEAYPLVMDAPLSAFDKRRIKTVCDTLPNIAEQVIIFIKDTDGEIAEEYLSDKIGAKYEFDKKSETETYFKERC